MRTVAKSAIYDCLVW